MTRRRCQRDSQQRCNFFLDIDDRFGVLQLPPQPCILPFDLRKFRRQRVARGRLGTALGRPLATKSPAVALPAPIRQGRRVQAFPAQDRPDTARLGRGVRLGQNPQLRLRRNRPAPRPVRKFGRRRRRGRHYARPTASLRASPDGGVHLLGLVSHNHDDCPSPPSLNFKDSDVSSSLARRGVDFTRRGQTVVILLCGGDKRTQSKDIRKAMEIAEALED